MMKLELISMEHIRIRGISFMFSNNERLWVNFSDIDLADEKTLRTLQQVRDYHSNIVAHFYLKEVRDRLRRVLSSMDKYGWKEDSPDERFASPAVSLYESFRGSGKISELRAVVSLAKEQPFFSFDNTFLDIPEQIEGFIQQVEHYKRIARARRFPKEHSGFVYLIKLSTGHYKIGFSNDPKKRIRNIGSGMPVEKDLIHEIASNQIACMEDELHDQYKHKRYKKTEWFSLDSTEVDEIKAITERNYEWIDNPEWQEIIKSPVPLKTVPPMINLNSGNMEKDVGDTE